MTQSRQVECHGRRRTMHTVRSTIRPSHPVHRQGMNSCSTAIAFASVHSIVRSKAILCDTDDSIDLSVEKQQERSYSRWCCMAIGITMSSVNAVRCGSRILQCDRVLRLGLWFVSIYLSVDGMGIHSLHRRLKCLIVYKSIQCPAKCQHRLEQPYNDTIESPIHMTPSGT